MKENYFILNKDRTMVRDPVTEAWLDWQTVLELVWERLIKRGERDEQSRDERKLHTDEGGAAHGE